MRAENDPVFTEWLKRKNNKYTSPEIQNEILKKLALTILRDVVESIKAVDFFSIMLEESGDVSNMGQAVFRVRWIDENLTLYEDFLGLYEMEKTDADSIVRIIKDSLLCFGFDKEKLRGQCYDGCSTMMGTKTGVSKQVKNDVQPLALSTHCYAHSLNLACGDWMKNSSVVSKSLATSYEITKLVKFSPKRDSHLRKIHEEEYYDDDEYNDMLKTVRLFSETRWTVRAGSLSSIYENYKELDQLRTWCLDVYKGTESKARVNDFDKNRFHVQLETLNKYCKEIDQSDVFCLRTVVNVLRRPEVKSHLSEVVKLAKLILVLPATNATSERTFSLMKLIKSYLRATMKQSTEPSDDPQLL